MRLTRLSTVAVALCIGLFTGAKTRAGIVDFGEEKGFIEASVFPGPSSSEQLITKIFVPSYGGYTTTGAVVNIEPNAPNSLDFTFSMLLTAVTNGNGNTYQPEQTKITVRNNGTLAIGYGVFSIRPPNRQPTFGANLNGNYMFTDGSFGEPQVALTESLLANGGTMLNYKIIVPGTSSVPVQTTTEAYAFPLDATVPEPSCLAFIGLAGIGLIKRRTRDRKE